MSPRDEAHRFVTAFNATPRRPIVTSAWILKEVGGGLAATPARHLFGTLLERLQGDSRVTVVPASSGVFERGVALYRARTDKQWSLTDCISFEIMREFGITDALTADHHFEQAGFVGLLK